MSKGEGKPMCKYGLDCYRQNPLHFQQFAHPEKDSLQFSGKKRERETFTDETEFVTKAKKTKLKSTEGSETFKWTDSKNAFGLKFTTVSGLHDEDQNRSCVKLCDVLNRTDTDLEESVQFNYMFDIEWILDQYPKKTRDKPLLLVHGFSGSDKSVLHAACVPYNNITLSQAQLNIPYGTHHTKMMILKYSLGLVVVVHTSNLVANDWFQKTQGLWISPLLPRIELNTNEANQLKTNQQKLSPQQPLFKNDLINYLHAYKLASVKQWIEKVEGFDFSSVGPVRLVGSVPGRFIGTDAMKRWGHMRLRDLLLSNTFENKTSTLVAQFSSIGSLGPSEDKWLTSEFTNSLSPENRNSSHAVGVAVGNRAASLKLVFPSVEDVRCSLEGYRGGGCLPYSSNTANKQLWLNKFFHRWKCDKYGRSEACPHIKTYTAITENNSVNWFLLTSANLSKAAWGAFEKNNSQLLIRSYELGVLIIPHLFNDLKFVPSANDKLDIIPFDYPLKKYSPSDKPWVVDQNHDNLPDTHGNVWCPR